MEVGASAPRNLSGLTFSLPTPRYSRSVLLTGSTLQVVAAEGGGPPGCTIFGECTWPKVGIVLDGNAADPVVGELVRGASRGEEETLMGTINIY